MIKPKVVLLIFVSGKIVLTGAKVIYLSCSFGCRNVAVLLTFNSCITLADTTPNRSLGEGRDLYGVQHHLHGALRIPKAMNVAQQPLYVGPYLTHERKSADVITRSFEPNPRNLPSNAFVCSIVGETTEPMPHPTWLNTDISGHACCGSFPLALSTFPYLALHCTIVHQL
jgi:Transcription factor TFIID (or TATA-binding protein, TBP)